MPELSRIGILSVSRACAALQVCSRDLLGGTSPDYTAKAASHEARQPTILSARHPHSDHVPS